MTRHRLLSAVVLSLALAGLSACVGYGSMDGQGKRMSREEMTVHVEHVFRRHNQVETRLLSVLQILNGRIPPSYEALLQAEADMLDACDELNEFAIRRRDDRRIGIVAKWRIPRSTQDCERKTQVVEELLDEIERV